MTSNSSRRRLGARSRLAAACSLAMLAASAPALAITVDGKIDPAEWQGAEHVTDFRLTDPLTGAPSPYPTEAWILSTPEGLAIGFRNTQPASVPRTYRRTQRDEDAAVDRVNLMIDYDGDGRSGYNFTVNLTDGIIDATITNESNFSKDWDGNWKHAVSEDGDTWSVEMLIPWYVAPMKKSHGDKRVVAIYLDRVVGSTGERVAWPEASYTRPRFLSDFRKIEIPQYGQSLFAITPYVVASYDNIDGTNHNDAGAEIVWKPNGQTQLTATINPDFGQIESDDLVVNFDANETFYSDKRPFFTENQGIFEFTTPSDFSQLLYTRRVGGPADDHSGPGDITAAVKLNGSLGVYKYGVFAADEADEAGRSFRALRLTRDFRDQNLGVMVTNVDRPFLDRQATTWGVDHNWRPSERLNISTRLLGSYIDQAGQTSRGTGATTIVTYEMDHGWRQQWLAMHFGDSLEINDFGYLSRANLNYGHWQLSHRITDFAEDSKFSSNEWRWRVSGTNDDHGLALQRQFRVSWSANQRDGGNQYAQINLNTAGYSDRLLRGHGIVRTPPSFNAYYERFRARKGNWELYGNVNLNKGGVGERKLGYNALFKPTYFFSDALSAFVTFYYETTPNWMVWQHDDLFGTFNERAAEFDAGLNWTIGDKQELRVKLQALGLDAKLRQAWRPSLGGQPIAVADPVDDFSLRNLGFQIRYRRELAPLSDLFIVYGRGGYVFNQFSEDSFNLLQNSFSLRDSEQLLVKISYRFEK